jgi:hypothetical protein
VPRSGGAFPATRGSATASPSRSPANRPDAYGAWWISVYDLAALSVACAEMPESISEATAQEEEKDKVKKRSRSWRR